MAYPSFAKIPGASVAQTESGLSPHRIDHCYDAAPGIRRLRAGLGRDERAVSRRFVALGLDSKGQKHGLYTRRLRTSTASSA